MAEALKKEVAACVAAASIVIMIWSALLVYRGLTRSQRSVEMTNIEFGINDHAHVDVLNLIFP